MFTLPATLTAIQKTNPLANTCEKSPHVLILHTKRPYKQKYQLYAASSDDEFINSKLTDVAARSFAKGMAPLLNESIVVSIAQTNLPMNIYLNIQNVPRI